MEVIAIILWLLGFIVGYIDGLVFSRIDDPPDKDDLST
jgi:hypothetical protein